MTNHWIDIKNTKLNFVCGSNGAENHPVVMQWINESLANGAKLVVADPRKTRMAGIAQATGGKWIRMRPGTNAAFMMGLINYAIQNNRADLTYLGQKVTTRLFNADSGGNGNAQLDATSTYGGWPKWTDASLKLNTARTDYVRAPVSASGVAGTNTETVSGMPVVLADWQTNPDSVWSYLKQKAAVYTSDVVEDICDISKGTFNAFADIVTAASSQPANIQYAMGGTQHSHASQDLRAYCILQLVLGNMGKAGGGVNALRGIHNVQGSTDMGVLNGFIPGYSSVPAVGQTYAAFQNGQFGNRQATGTGAPYWSGLQQKGNRNLMWHYFRQGADPVAAEYSATGNSNFDLMPKGAGYNHRKMFEMMQPTVTTGKVKCLVAFGQNPAVTEPNLTLVKNGLKELDTLVVMDMFESETAGCDRKGTGVTYLLPAAGFVEEEGSTTNSGRWIQWRYKAINPQGGSKSDTEILLRLADKLITAGAFSHIPGGTYANLYSYYGWTPGTDFNAGTVAATVAEKIYAEMCANNQDVPASGTPLDGWGGLWIYKNGYGGTTNKAKGRSTTDASGLGLYPGWGWAWIVNRRVFYNNGGVSGDVADTMVAPDKVARMYVHSAGTPPLADYSNTYRAYSKITGGEIPQHREPFETPRLDLLTQYGNISTAPTTAPTGPWATVQTTLSNNRNVNDTSITVGSAAGLANGDILTINPGGSNQENIMIALSGGISGNTITLCTIDNPTGLTKAHTAGELVRKDLTATYPLVLTTFRVTEHFQGGPMTRNVPWLCELVPEAIIEINSVDAYALGINTGDNVYVDTVRASNIGPFKAVVGTGGQENQRVAKGYVAVPWHWGNKGLKTGPSANDVTIDSLDPDAAIQETKACTCRIHK